MRVRVAGAVLWAGRRATLRAKSGAAILPCGGVIRHADIQEYCPRVDRPKRAFLATRQTCDPVLAKKPKRHPRFTSSLRRVRSVGVSECRGIGVSSGGDATILNG